MKQRERRDRYLEFLVKLCCEKSHRERKRYVEKKEKVQNNTTKREKELQFFNDSYNFFKLKSI